MGYVGTTASIPIGQGGLHTDDPQVAIPPNAAIVANNVSLYRGRVEKSPGTAKYSTTQLPAAVVALQDWWPTPVTQRLVAVTADGKMFKDSDGTFASTTPLNTVETQKIAFSAIPTGGAWSAKQGTNAATGTLAVTAATVASDIQTHLRTISGLASVVVSGTMSFGFLVRFDGTTGDQAMLADNSNTLTNGSAVTVAYTEVFKGGASLGLPTTDSHLCAGGAEAAGNNRKLFFFSSTTQVKVLSGDSGAIGNIRVPALDWTSNFPTFGIPYQGRMVAFGNANSRHTLYISALGDHENFNSGGSTAADSQSYQIFSGEGDQLVAAAVYKGTLVLFKKPFGVYTFAWDGSSLPAIDRFSDAFGIASPHGTQIVLDDLLGASNSNSVFSLKATQAFGDLEQGDVLSQCHVRDYIRQALDPSGVAFSASTYYPEKEIAMFSGRNTSAATANNRLMMLDVSKNGQPRLTLETKDAPDCMALRKDTNGVLRPIYGGSDGYVYKMDQGPRNVAGAAYLGEFQTPFIDFSYMDATLSDKTKLFDFLQITYTSVGAWSFYVDVYVDGVFSETVTYLMTQRASLDSFVLNRDRLASLQAQTNRRPLHCSGKSISFRIYNGNLNETFSVERLVVGFRVGAEGNRSSVA